MSFLGFGGGGGNTISVRVIGDASQLNKELKGARGEAQRFEKETGQSVSRLSTGIKSALKVGAAAAVLGFANESIQAFSDLNESTNAVRVTFGDAGDDILELGKKAAETRGISNAAFNSMAVQFSAFAETVAGQSGRGVADVIDELTLRGTDFASVMNLEVGDALQKFQSGLAGEIEPLRKFGIDMSAAAVKAKALELGIGSTTGELTEQEKVLVRYQLLMEQTEKTAGDFANTSEDLANKQRITSARFEDAKASIGEGLVPVMTTLLEVAEPLISVLGALGEAVGFFTRETDKMKESDNAFAKLGGSLADIVKKGALPFMIEGISEFFGLFDDSPIPEATKAQKELGRQMSEDADRVLRGKYIPAVEETVLSTEDLIKAEERQREATERAKKALREKQEALRNIHNPLFRAVSLTDDLAEAEKEVEKASKKGVGSDEYRDAVIDRAEVLSDLTDTVLELLNMGIIPTGAAARQMLSGLGIPDEVITGIFADIDAVIDKIESSNPRMTIDMFIPTTRLPGTTAPIQGNNVVSQFHEGGVVPGLPGQNRLAMLAGGETILPTHDPLKMNGMGGGNVTIVNIGTQLGAERKLREIQEEARRQ